MNVFSQFKSLIFKNLHKEGEISGFYSVLDTVTCMCIKMENIDCEKHYSYLETMDISCNLEREESQQHQRQSASLRQVENTEGHTHVILPGVHISTKDCISQQSLQQRALGERRSVCI